VSLSWLDFVELPGFTDDWSGLGLTDADLFEAENIIAASPHLAPVIAGTGGLRKLRFAPLRWGRGKRGGARICFFRFDEYQLVFLVAAYAKNEQADLSAADRKHIRDLATRIGRELSRRYGRQR
jgi:hypothetical protein